MNVKNRKCILRLSLRSLWASRKRNIIAIIAIMLTTLLFTSIFTITMSINSSYEMYTFRQIGGYNHGTFKEVTNEQAKAIAAHPKVKASGICSNIGFINSGNFSKVTAELSYMDKNCTKWAFAEPTTGHMPKSGNEISMDTTSLALLGVEPKLGANITLTYTIGDHDRYSYEKTDTFTLVGWWEYDTLSPVHYINISEEYANSVIAEGTNAGIERFRQDLNVMLKSSINIEEQMEQVNTDLGYTWESHGDENNVPLGVNWGYTTVQLSTSVDSSTIIGITAFLTLVIFTGYLIIYNVFQISVTGDIRFYGLLKTIGVTPKQLSRIIRQQALMLCIIGIPLGLLSGYGVGALLTPVVMAESSYGATITMLSTSPLIFIASALFAILTVLLSCSRPGRIAARVSPIEATKYTDATPLKKAKRTTHGAKVYQMAFANLGRNKQKTVLVTISLAFAVVLLNILVTFTGGFDMEKYLEHQICADFIVSSNEYFTNSYSAENYISKDIIKQIEADTSQSLSGCGYRLAGEKPIGWMPEDSWQMDVAYYYDSREKFLSQRSRRGDLVGENCMMEGFDDAIFEKLTVIKGELSPLFQEGSNAIAVAVHADDFGNINNLDYYPPIGSTQTITYIDEAYYTDGNYENAPPEYHIVRSHDVDYTVCAYVVVPDSIGFRYHTMGYSFILPADRLSNDSGQTLLPIVYLFDTTDDNAEKAAEDYLDKLTKSIAPELMYESKNIIRAEFASFQNMFLLLGGLLCAIIGLVGILNFFNAIMTGILSRKREFAVLKAVGMTNRQLKSMLIYEGLFYTLGSALASLILSVLFNPLVGRLLESMFWFFSANHTIITILLSVPVFALLGWLIPTILYGQTAKHSVVEQLREIE
ncbi:MAG: FtsX-like permease family protein [Lachnospiraceae bacterium]|nr:FtsX-like permease family protein [Lachnospiraceae bacterium]